MAGRLKDMLINARCCFSVTKSIKETMRFVWGGNNGKVISLRLKTGTVIYLRNNKVDRDVFLSTFYNKYHRIPYELQQAPVIIDLGANTGLTIIDYLEQYPDARVTGVEMDQENFMIAQKNTAKYENVTLLHKAVWKEDGTISYSGQDSQSYRVDLAAKHKTAAISMDKLLQGFTSVDLIKMDIEGAEYAILLEDGNKSWLRKTKYLNIEVHNTPQQDAQTGLQKIIELLQACNFIAATSDNHWSSVIAVNKDLA